MTRKLFPYFRLLHLPEGWSALRLLREQGFFVLPLALKGALRSLWISRRFSLGTRMTLLWHPRISCLSPVAEVRELRCARWTPSSQWEHRLEQAPPSIAAK